MPSANTPVRDVFHQSGLTGKASLALATWFGAGLLPGAPGTFGTLGAVPLLMVLDRLGMIWQGVVWVLIAGLATWASHRVRTMVGHEDPPQVVIDEVTGFSITVLFVPITWFTLGLCFVLFRFFDIAKPFPIRRLERLGGGLGIVADDVMAGIYTVAAVTLARHLLQ
jgi:phosphatidylglycerophosphatase A